MHVIILPFFKWENDVKPFPQKFTKQLLLSLQPRDTKFLLTQPTSYPFDV
jgi:hypothetical protein